MIAGGTGSAITVSQARQAYGGGYAGEGKT
jgi:hypothetical protein